MSRLPLSSTLFPYTTLFRSNQVYGYGKDEGALPLLYAAVLDGKIRRVMLDGMLVSYESVVSSRVHRRIREGDRKSTRLNSSHTVISYAVFCLKKKKQRTASM